MEEASRPKRNPKKSPKRRDGGTPKALPRAPLLSLQTWGILGVSLVGGVVVWKLAVSSYRADIETICNAERDSRLTVEKDMAKVTQWVRGHLATPEGNEFFSTLGDMRLADRGRRLKDEASAQRVANCPIVSSYELVAAEGDYRSDLQHLCSSAAFARMAELDDDARLARLEDWIDKQAKSPRTKELADLLRRAKTGADRARLLRDAAGKMDVYSCDGAKTLESPQAAPPPSVPTVRVAAAPQIIGPIEKADLAKAIVDITPALDDCYRKGLDRTPTLSGKLAVKFEVDPDGKVTHASPADASFADRETSACILRAVHSLKAPKNPGPRASVLLPLELTGGQASAKAP